MKTKRSLHLCGEYITYTDKEHAIGFYYTVNGKTGVHIYAKNKKHEDSLREQIRELTKGASLGEDYNYEWRDILSDLKNFLGQIQVQPLEEDGERMDEGGNLEEPQGPGGEIYPYVTE